MKRLLLVASFFYSIQAFAQTDGDWVKLVNWDGITPWRQYIIYAPAFMGPNALPVPEMGNGSVDSSNWLSAGGTFHFRCGDHTQNLRLGGSYCLVKDFISADINWIPVESFSLSHRVKEERRVYYKDYYDHEAKGDIYFNVNIQLLNRWRKHIHLVLRSGFRYPTSNEVGSARFTDAPGYHFDISCGLPLGDKRFKFTGMAGFYVWHLNTFGQDDAILFGGGFEYNHNNLRWQLNCRGYSGYLNNGDRPVIIGSILEKKSKHCSWMLGLHQGLNDYKYTSIDLGVKYFLVSTQLAKQ